MSASTGNDQPNTETRTPARPPKPNPDFSGLPNIHGIVDLPAGERLALTKTWQREYAKAKRNDRLARGIGTPQTRRERQLWGSAIGDRAYADIEGDR